MQKIRDLEINQMVSLPLVVFNATARETKAKKPYLQLELFDGVDKIGGNYWDWAAKNIPAKNTILDVTAQVTEWQGAKQLNIKQLSTNTTLHLSEFTPSSGVDMSDVYKEAYSLVCDVTDDMLRSIALALLEDLQSKWLTVPGAKSVHHAFIGGTLQHSLSVAKIAKSIASNIPAANEDLCVVGSILHDIGKLFSYTMDGIAIDTTDEGRLYDHLFIGAELIGAAAKQLVDVEDTYNQAKLTMLRHIILSHHGKLEYGAVVPPQSIEAHIVHYADTIDALTQQVIECSKKVGQAKWTERIYTLGNQQHLAVQYVQEVFLRK